MKKLIGVVLGGLLLVGGAVVVTGGADASSGTPTIAGSGQIGSVVKVTRKGTFERTPASYTYDWLWDGDSGPTDHKSSHTVTEADSGRQLSVLVTALDGKGRIIDRLPSNSITVTIAPRVPTIQGTRRVPHELTLSFDGGSSGVDVTQVEWLRDGARMEPREFAFSYVLTDQDAGHRVTAVATSSKDGEADVTATSEAAAIPAHNLSRPTIAGTAKVGRTLKRTSSGTWARSGGAFSYRWLRDGSAISGATKSSYELTSKDRGRKISLRVTWKRTGFASTSATSVATAEVAR